jgi:hypothetical protein
MRLNTAGDIFITPEIYNLSSQGNMSNRNYFTVSILKILVMSGRHAEPNVQEQVIQRKLHPQTLPTVFLLQVFEYRSTFMAPSYTTRAGTQSYELRNLYHRRLVEGGILTAVTSVRALVAIFYIVSLKMEAAG